MRSIVYFSTATHPMPQEALEALRRECVDNDSHIGITGMLLHKQGCFLQVIEGNAPTIRDMYARITADPRHTGIQLISDRTIDRREFEGSSLGFRDLDHSPPGTPFLSPFSAAAFLADPNLALLTLAYFYRNQ